jgi:hypothetical protein
MSRILSIVAVLSLVGFVTVGCSPEAQKKVADAASQKAGEAVDAAKSSMGDVMSKATDALASVEGGSDMLKQITELFGTATKTIGGVTDEASANTALPEINKLTDSFGGLTDLYAKLPDAAKAAVANVFQNSLGDLKPTLDKVLAIPGVEAILKPAIEALMQKLATFKA